MHLGRVWLAYWMFPIPNERTIWPNFHSPLMWDLLAITTYLLCSTMYLFLPLIPDLAMARDRTKAAGARPFYKTLALGFRGTEGEWTTSDHCHEHLCLCDHPGHVLGAYHRVLGLCHGFPPRLVSPRSLVPTS